MENRNFILPETETTINIIISEVTRFFDIVRIGAMIVFLIYISLRLIFFSISIWIDISLLVIYFVQTVLIVLEFLKRIKFQKTIRVMNVTKRIVSLIMIVIYLQDIFAAYKEIRLWQILAGLVMGFGLMLLLLGDAFQFVIPRYCDMILTSFKNDINVRGLVSRGMAEVKSATKDTIKSDVGKKVIKTAGTFAIVGTIGMLIKKIRGRWG